MSDAPVIHWFRRDLRLSDNTALAAALRTNAPVLPLFIFDPALLAGERFSSARLAFMLKGLQAIAEAIKQFGGNLFVRHGDPQVVLPQLVDQVGAQAVYWNRDYSPYARHRDAALERALAIPIYSFDDLLLHEPGSVLKEDGQPYTIYTPFWRRWASRPKPAPISVRLERGCFCTSDAVSPDNLPTAAELGCADAIAVPEAGERVARRRLEAFIEQDIFQYAERRNDLVAEPFTDPAPKGTSYLSPYIRFGMLSPRQLYAAAAKARDAASSRTSRASAETWIGELAWREFYTHILYHFPQVLNTSFRPEYENVEWRSAPAELERWQAGQTGFPIVDAAMRQLNTIGWMHNRARMIVASFLTKDLLIYWREGETYFMRRLIDGDPAANNGGWQWSAGTGTDAQPYFRIFNPVSQSQKFDPNGAYIRRWVPELRDVPAKFIHAPWQLDEPPRAYPPPMIDHSAARARTLTAFKAIKIS
ncbi:MAG: deoxyribodipyrimidine photo-lyase [Aggregatilineales bacterium]